MVWHMSGPVFGCKRCNFDTGDCCLRSVSYQQKTLFSMNRDHDLSFPLTSNFGKDFLTKPHNGHG